LEYIVVHELAHLLEPNHSAKFSALLDANLPAWRQYKKLLAEQPLAHQTWP
jgi:predicted metal-dependent hydrolase